MNGIKKALVGVAIGLAVTLASSMLASATLIGLGYVVQEASAANVAAESAQGGEIKYWMVPDSVRQAREACQGQGWTGPPIVLRPMVDHVAWWQGLTPAQRTDWDARGDRCELAHPVPGKSGQWDTNGLVSVDRDTFYASFGM